MMFGIDRLQYNNTNAASIAASSSVGARVLAGTDGTEIGAATINSLPWLRVAATLLVGGTTELTATGGSLNVTSRNVFNTAFAGRAQSVSTAAVELRYTALTRLANRQFLFIQNLGYGNLYVGGAGVTTTTGLLVPRGQAIELRAGPDVAVFGIADRTTDVRVWAAS